MTKNELIAELLKIDGNPDLYVCCEDGYYLVDNVEEKEAISEGDYASLNDIIIPDTGSKFIKEKLIIINAV